VSKVKLRNVYSAEQQ